MAHFITFQVNNCSIVNSNVIWGSNLPSGLCALFLGNEYIPLLQLSVSAVWMSVQHPHIHKDLNIEPYGFTLLQTQEEILDNFVVLICQRKIMQVFLHYNLMWAPLWASCSFQRSSLSGNAHKAASECRTSSGSVPAGRAKRRFIPSFVRVYCTSSLASHIFIVPSRALLWRHQTTAECLCWGRSCFSTRCCFHWSARPTLLTCPSPWQDISSSSSDLVCPEKHTGHNFWGHSASSWDTLPGPPLALDLQLSQLGSLFQGLWHFGQHLLVFDWGFEK